MQYCNARLSILVLLISLCLITGLNAQTSWIGGVNTSWGLAGNWTNGVPTSTIDVIIGDANFTGANQPSITTKATCKSLTIGAGTKSSTLTLGSRNKNLTVSGSIIIGTVGTISQSQRNTITLTGDFNKSGIYSATNNNASLVFAGISQVISGSSTIAFKKLTINASSTTILQVNCTATNVTVNGVLNPGESPSYLISGIGTLTVGLGGTLQVRASTFAGNYGATTVVINAGSTVEYASTTTNQTVSNAYTYSTLRISGGLRKSLSGNLPAFQSAAVNYGNVFVDSGTFDLSSFTANRGTTVAGGNFNVANGATLKIGGTNSFPINYATIILGAASTVEYSGTNQIITALPYGNLTMSSSSGVAVKTMPATAMTIFGNLTSSVGTGTAVNFTAGNSLNVGGNVTIGISTTFNGSSYVHTLLGNWTNNGTFNGGTSKVAMNGTGCIISGTGANNFYDLEIREFGINALGSTNMAIAGNLTTIGNGTFTHAMGGLLTMSGTPKYINGSGISLANLTVTGTVTDSTDLIIGGNLQLSGSGSFNAAAGTITLTGSSSTITNSGSGALTVNALTITGNITTGSDFSIRSNFAVTGSFTATSGRITFIGSTTISGIVNIYNGTLNGTLLQLGGNAILGVAGETPLLVAGTFDPITYTPNTVDYNGSISQVIVPVTYYNLSFSNGGTKSVNGSVSVINRISINSGATFNGGSYTHTIYGDWYNDGTFLPSTGAIQFSGSNDEYIFGSSTTTFNVLTLSKPSMESMLTLLASVNASTVNMTSGKIDIPDSTKSITITTTRTGNGKIEGTITRIHSFVNGVPYAFESPFNTITFTGGGTNPTSVTERILLQPPQDFIPEGTSVLETYTISQTGGSGYTATLRLDYDAKRLNGNDPLTLHIFRYVGGTWVDSGATASDTTDKWVEKSGVTDLSGRWTFYSSISGILDWTGAVSNDWATYDNWSVVSGSPSVPPDDSTYVRLGYVTCSNQPTINTPSKSRIISFGSVQGITLTLTGGGSLDITGSSGYTGSWTSNVTHTVNINSQSIKIGGDLILGPNVSDRHIDLAIGNGSLTVSGNIDQLGDADINISGTGTILLTGNWSTSSSATFTPGTGTVVYYGNGSQLVATWNYNNLNINKSGGTAILPGNINILGNLTIDSTGGAFQIHATILSIVGNVSIGSGTTLDAGSALINVGGNWTTNGTFVPGGSTLTFNGTGTQTISPGILNRLTIAKPSGIFTPTGNLLTNGNFTISSGVVDLSTYNINRSALGGIMSMGAGSSLKMGTGSRIPSNYSTYIYDSTSTQEFYGTDAQPIAPITYGNMILTNGTSTAKVLTGNITIGGDFVISSSASLNAGSHRVTVNGNWNNDGIFTSGTGTIVLYGTNKSVASSGNLNLNNLSIVGSYTAAAPQVHVGGNLALTNGSLDLGTTTIILDGNVEVSGILSTNGTVTYSGTRQQTLHLVNPIVFSSNGVVNFNGTVRPVMSSASSPTYYTVNVNNIGGIAPGADWTVNGPITISSASSFVGGNLNHTFFANVTNNGTMSSSGILNFLPNAPATITLKGVAFNSTGTVNFGGTGSISIVGNPSLLQNILITNTNPAGITPPSGWTLNENLVIGSGSTFHAGTGLIHSIGTNFTCDGIFQGSSSTIVMNNPTQGNIQGGGTINFYNITIAGTIVALCGINVSGTFTYDGTFDGSASDVYFTGSTPSIITGIQPTPSFPFLVNLKSNATTTLNMNLIDVVSLIDSSGTMDLSTFTLTQDAAGGILAVKNGALLQIGGSNTLPTFNTYDVTPLSTVEYNGTGAQSISTATGYGNLTLSNIGTKTATGALNVATDFSLSTCAFIGGAFTHTVGGNWTMTSGTFNNTGTTIFLNGTGPQTVGSTGAFNNLTVNKSTGRLSASTDIRINGSLTLTNGKFITGINKVILTSGASSSRTNGYIAGNLQKYLPAGAISTTYDIGDTVSYTPVNISFANVSTAGNLMVNTTFGDHPNISSSLINPSMSVNRYWTFTNAGVVFSTYNATFNFVSGDLDPAAVTGSFVVERYSSGSWALTATGIRTSTSTQATGLTTFSDFQIGDSISNPVPTTTSLNTTHVVAGSGSRTDTINGTNFTVTSVVHFGGFERVTTFISSSQLAFTLLSTDVRLAGTYPVTVFNPTPGGGTSNPQSFTVSPAPLNHFTISSISSPQIAGQNISLTITARDSIENIITSFNGTVDFTTTAGTVMPSVSNAFVNGQLTQSVFATQSGADKSITVTRTGGTETGVSSLFTIDPAILHHFKVDTVSSPQTVGVAFNIRVTAQDTFNNIKTSFTGTVDLTTNGGAISPPISGAFEAGVRTESITLSQSGNGRIITASRTGGTETGTSNSFTVDAAIADHLVYVQQPSSATAGVAINPSITVQLKDLYGNNVPQSGVSISMELTTGTGTLSGTAVKITDTSGLATFNDLSINLVGLKVLTALSSGLTSAASNSFTISHASAYRLTFDVQPTTTIAGETISPAVTVRIEDDYGNLIVEDTRDVAISIGTNPGWGTLSGTTAVAAVGGIATFSNLSIDKVGIGYTLNAGSNPTLIATASDTFNITVGVPAKLAFGTHPSATVAGSYISPTVTVQILDSNDNLIISDNSTTVTLAVGTNPGSGILSGTTISTASAGIASFSNLSIDKTGTGYTLNANCSPSLTGATSSTFDITPGPLNHFLIESAAGGDIPTQTAGTPFSIRVMALDIYNNSVTTFNGTADITSNGTLSSGGGTTEIFTDGALTSHSVTITNTGSFTITATATGGVETGTSNSFNVGAAGTGYLEFVQQPANTTAGQVISPPITVQLKDAYGNNVLQSGVWINMAIYSGTGTLNGTTLCSTNVNGLAAFNDLSIDSGGSKSLTASSTGLTLAVSSAFEIISLINTFTLNVSAVNGSVIKAPDQASYNEGTSVELTAIPESGYHFVGWSGDASGSNNPLTIGMNSNKNITANFGINIYTLSISAVNGLVIKNPEEVNYNHGTSVQLTAVPNSGYHFTGWSGDTSGNVNPLNIVMNENKFITANFAIDAYTLSISAVNGYVTKVPDQSAYDNGTSVQLTATPYSGYHFAGWSGDASGITNPLTCVMDGNKSITANFAINTYTLSISAVNGSVTKVPDQMVYNHGTSVQLIASANSGYHFTSWSGDTSGVVNPITIVMDRNKSIIANYTFNTYSLNISAVNGSVLKIPDQTVYDHGISVQISAAPDYGYHFAAWTGDITGSVNPTVILMDANKNISANFAINVYTITTSSIGNGTIMPSGAVNVNHGGSRIFTITPAIGYHTDSVIVDGLNIGVVPNYLLSNVTTNHSITGYFSVDQYSLYISINGMGSVLKNPDQLMYPYGSTVILTAIANTGYYFAGWGGDFSGRINPVSIQIFAPKNITATFASDTISSMMYRSFMPESLALSWDNKGRLGKIVKRKPDKVDFECFVINTVDGANQLHIEFTRSVDTTISPMATIPSSTLISEDPRMRKWTYIFEYPLHAGDTVYISGYGRRGKFQKVYSYWWLIDGISAGEKRKDAIFIRNILKMPMPNRINVLYETFAQGGYLSSNGMIVGIARADSPKYYGWFQTMRYTNVVKSLIKSRTMTIHEAPPHGFDVFSNGRVFNKPQKILSPINYNNRLFASMIALKLNIVASAMGKTPRGFGELVYDDDSGNPLNGMMVKEIANYGDSLMMGWYNHQQSRKLYAPKDIFWNLDTTIQRINRAFESTLDTISFGDSLIFTGAKRLGDVPYMIYDFNIMPDVIIAKDVPLYEVPEKYLLHQNYPNPFNPVTTIEFELPVVSKVTLIIYNMLGQEVATLMRNEVFDDGMQEVDFDASNLTSGVYFYHFRAEPLELDEDELVPGIFTSTGKMLLLK